MRVVEAADALGSRDETEELEPRDPAPLERAHGIHRAPTGGEHRIQQEDLSALGPRGDLEVVLDGLERSVIAKEPDVSDACGGNESEDARDHAKAGAEDRDEGHRVRWEPLRWRGFEGRLDGAALEGEIGGRLVGQ